MHARAAIALDRERGRLVHAEAQQRPAGQRRGRGHERDQPAEAGALAEMRIGDHAAQQRDVQEIVLDRVAVAERIGERARTGLAAAVHRAVDVLAEDREAGAGAAERLARAHVRVQRRGHRRALPPAHVARLVAPGDEDAVGTPQRAQDALVVRRLAPVENECLDRGDAADLAVELLADLAAERCAQHDDVAVAGLGHEPAQRLEVAVAAAHQQQARRHLPRRRGCAVAQQVAVVAGSGARRIRRDQRQHERQRPHPDARERQHA